MIPLPVLLASLTFLVSLLLASILYPFLIRALHRLRSGQVIQTELPASHQAKAGTPTGGGVLFILLGIVGGLLAHRAGHPGALPGAAGLLAGGLLGLADDFSKLRWGSVGIPARAKLPLQLLFAVPVAYLALQAGGGHQPPIPFELGLLYWPLAVLVIAGTANAVNFTDGMDGLAAGVMAIALAVLVLVVPGAAPGEKAVGVTLVGALAAFLIFNRHPARVFMGDTGSLALGFAVAAMAIQQRALFLLPLIAIIPLLEILSVMIQVGYFKTTGGRRFFKMTPIHFTFHLAGWSENRIALSFSGLGLAAALLAAWLGMRMTP